jgi:Vitamin K-dependent gamma-carboxylase
MTRLLRALERFWFPAAPAARLATLRILVGAFSLWLVATESSVWVRAGRTTSELFQPVGVVAVLSHPLPPAVNEALIIATLVASVLFMLGWHYRVTGPVFAALLWWVLTYRQSWSMIYHSENLVVLHALILGVAPAADVFSLDARRRRGDTSSRDLAGAAAYGWPIQLMCVATASAYFVTGMAKVTGELGWGWVTGEALRSQVAADALRKEVLGDSGSRLFYVLYPHLWLFTLFGVGTLLVELGAPLALLAKRIGRAWAANAFLMHWGILLIMSIKFRYHLSGVLYASFFPVERLVAGAIELWRRWSPLQAMPAPPRWVP